MSTTHALYRFFDETGQLLYVGISANPGNRFDQHRGDKPWWEEVSSITVQAMPDRQSAMDSEKAAIKFERPRYNVVHNQAVIRDTTTRISRLIEHASHALETANEHGGADLDTRVKLEREAGFNAEEARVLALAGWTDTQMHDHLYALETLIDQFPQDQIDDCRRFAKHELQENGCEVTRFSVLAQTAYGLADQIAAEYVNSLPEDVGGLALEGFINDSGVNWTGAAGKARATASITNYPLEVPF